MYLQCPLNNLRPRTANIVFYVLCLLYVLSTATIVSDLVALILEVSNISFVRISFFLSVVHWQWYFITLSESGHQLQTDPRPVLFRLMIVQSTASGWCDFIAQCIIVGINHFTSIIPFIYLIPQRSTIVGSCGVKISVS